MPKHVTTERGSRMLSNQATEDQAVRIARADLWDSELQACRVHKSVWWFEGAFEAGS
jgi:hypothetical protein